MTTIKSKGSGVYFTSLFIVQKISDRACFALFIDSKNYEGDDTDITEKKVIRYPKRDDGKPVNQVIKFVRPTCICLKVNNYQLNWRKQEILSAVMD